MSNSNEQSFYGNTGGLGSLKISVFDGTDPSAYPAWELSMQSLLLSKGLGIPLKAEPWEPVEQFRYAKVEADMAKLTQATLSNAQSTIGYKVGDLNLPFERRKLFDEDVKKLETKNSLAINFYQTYTKGELFLRYKDLSNQMIFMLCTFTCRIPIEEINSIHA